MEDNVNTSTIPTPDEKIMAAISNITAIVFFIGILAPIVIWITQKDKSPYLRFQALQAFAFQLLMIVIWLIGFVCYFCGFIFPIMGGMLLDQFGSGSGGEWLVIVPLLVLAGMGLLELILVLYAIAGAVQCLRGKDFHYLVLGTAVEGFLAKG